MKKVALLILSPLGPERSAINKLCGDICYAFTKLGTHIEIFAMSDKNATSDFQGFKHHEVKAHRLTNGKISIKRVIDLFLLGVLGFRLTVELVNRSYGYLEAIKKYGPDIIIVFDTITAKLIERYLDELKESRPKIICMTDSYRGIYTALDYLDSLGKPKIPRFTIKLIRKIMKKKYIKYNMYYYGLQASLSDAFVATDDFHKKEILRKFPQLRGRIFSVLPSFVKSPAVVKRNKPSKTIKTALFLGSFNHAPNFYAIEAIRLKIAPKFPSMKFIVSGAGCPNKIVGNMQYMDTSTPAKELLDKSDICLAPMWDENTGVRVKIFDYFAASKIVLGTKSTFIGYNVKDRFNCMIDENINRYCERIEEIQKNPTLAIKMQKNAYTALRGHYEKDYISSWGEILKHIDS